MLHLIKLSPPPPASAPAVDNRSFPHPSECDEIARFGRKRLCTNRVSKNTVERNGWCMGWIMAACGAQLQSRALACLRLHGSRHRLAPAEMLSPVYLREKTKTYSAWPSLPTHHPRNPFKSFSRHTSLRWRLCLDARDSCALHGVVRLWRVFVRCVWCCVVCFHADACAGAFDLTHMHTSDGQAYLPRDVRGALAVAAAQLRIVIRERHARL